VEFAIHETFEAREIRIHIRADVFGGNRGRRTTARVCSKGTPGLAIPCAPLASDAICGWSGAPPYAGRSAESVRQGRLNRRRGLTPLPRPSVAGRQAQIQRDDGSFASGILLDHGSEVQQVGSENLEPLLDFLNLVVDFFFDVGSLWTL